MATRLGLNIFPDYSVKVYRSVLKENWVDWLSSMSFDFAFTANFNREVSLVGAEGVLRRWARDIDRKVLGRHWASAPREKRLVMVGFPEHPHSNVHYHLLVRAPVAPLKVQAVAVKEWKRRVASGDLWASPLASPADIGRFAGYCGKDLWNGVGLEHFVVISGD